MPNRLRMAILDRKKTPIVQKDSSVCSFTTAFKNKKRKVWWHLHLNPSMSQRTVDLWAQGQSSLHSKSHGYIDKEKKPTFTEGQGAKSVIPAVRHSQGCCKFEARKTKLKTDQLHTCSNVRAPNILLQSTPAKIFLPLPLNVGIT